MSDTEQMTVLVVMFLILVGLIGYTIFLIKKNAQLTAQGQ